MTYLLCLLLALPFWHHKAPELFRVKFETTAGNFLIEAHRDWSPYGADRFYELVRTNYYDDSRFFRVVPEKLYSGYGEHSGGGMRAGHQDQIFEGGNAYLDHEYPKLDRLIRATVMKSN